MIRLSFYYFLFFSSQAVFISFVPLYLKDIGLGTGQIGMILAMGSFMAIFFQPVWGLVSDWFQSTKKTLLMVISSTFLLGIVFFSVKTYSLIMACYIFISIFRTSCTPLADNMAITYTNKHNKNYGLIRVWGDIGVGSSSLLLGIMISLLGIQKLGWMYGTILALAIPLAFSLIDSRPKKKTSINLLSLRKLLINKKYIGFVLICLIIFVPHRMNDSLFTVYISDLGASEKMIGRSWMIATFASIPAFIVTGRLVKRYSEFSLIMAAAILYSIRWILYSYFNDPSILTYLQFMQGLTFPVFSVAGLITINKIVPEELIATGQMIYTAAISGIGGIIGGAGGGWLMETYSPQLTYRFGSLLCLSGAILCIIMILMKKKSEKMKIKLNNNENSTLLP